jgi:hypothetical protein
MPFAHRLGSRNDLMTARGPRDMPQFNLEAEAMEGPRIAPMHFNVGVKAFAREF